jgi:hypothetical protein
MTKRNDRNKVRFGEIEYDPDQMLRREPDYPETTAGSVVLLGVVSSYDTATKIAYVLDSSNALVAADNFSGFALSAGRAVAYLLNGAGAYTIVGVKPV